MFSRQLNQAQLNFDMIVTVSDGYEHDPNHPEIVRFLSPDTNNSERIDILKKYRDGSFIVSLYRSIVYELNISELRSRLHNFYGDIVTLDSDLLLPNKY